MGVDAQMLLRTNGMFTDDEILSMAVNAYERFGDVLFVRNNESSGGKHHCITREEVYTQDGEGIVPEPGETFLNVHLSGRYYGEGYERGNLPDYIMLAEYFESIIPDVKVMYGGDSSGVCAEPFDKNARAELFSYFVKVGHRPYTSGFDSKKDGEECGLCKVKMTRCGWGGNYAKWYCHGCGTTVEMRDGVRTVNPK